MSPLFTLDCAKGPLERLAEAVLRVGPDPAPTNSDVYGFALGG